MKATNLDVTAREGEWRSRPITAAALVVAVVTGALIVLEIVRPVHSIDGGGRAAIETAVAAAAVLTVHLLLQTFDRGRQLRELLLVLGVFAVSIGEFAYWAGPVVAGTSTAAPGGPARLTCELIGAVVLAAAAFVPAGVIVRRPGGWARMATLLGVATIAVALVVADALAAHASHGAAATGTVHSVGVGLDLLSAAVLAVAGLAFFAGSWQVERGSALLAGASLLLAAAGLQFVAVPVVPAGWVTPRDGARLAAFVLLLGGAYLRYVNVQRRRAHAAICSERERVARDLHDGLAQDLACITTQAQRLDCRMGPQHPLMLATRDALAELRVMIADLTASTAATSEEAVRLVARDQGRRLDLDVDVRADAGGESGDGGLELGSRDDLIRATREAITNAAVDGETRQVDVSLSRRAGHMVVRVSGRAHREPEGSIAAATRARYGRGVSRLSAHWSHRDRRA